MGFLCLLLLPSSPVGFKPCLQQTLLEPRSWQTGVVSVPLTLALAPAHPRHHTAEDDDDGADEDEDGDDEDKGSQGERKGKGQMGGRCVQCLEVRQMGAQCVGVQSVHAP